MTARGPVVELRTRRKWRILMGLAVPAFAAVMVLAAWEILSREQVSGPAVITLVFIVAALGGLIVVPGTAMLVRHFRGVPDVRFDDQGIVWGRDRARDMAIDWRDIDRVSAKTQETKYLTDRLFVLHPRPGRSGSRATTLYGRIMGAGNRLMYGGPFVISTVAADRSWDEILQVLAAHLPNAKGPFETS